MENLRTQHEALTPQDVATEILNLFRQRGTDDNTTARQLTLGDGKTHLTVSFRGEQPPNGRNGDIIGLANIVGPILEDPSAQGNLTVLIDEVVARIADPEEDATYLVTYSDNDWAALRERLYTWEPIRQTRQAA